MSRHFLAVCAAAATMAVAAMAVAFALLPRGHVRSGPVANVPNQGSPSTCIVTDTMTVNPDVLLLGEEITVTLGVQASCPDTPGRLDIVLVLDGSGSMQRQPTQQMKQAAAKFVRDLDLPGHPERRVGVVEFNQVARRLCSLGNNPNQAIGCINRVGANGRTRIDLGIIEGLNVLTAGHPGHGVDDWTGVMIVLSNGSNDAGCAPVLAAARRARDQGVLVITICVGKDCDEQCMRQAASGPQYYYAVPDPRDLTVTFEAILRQLLQELLRRLTITDTWGDRYVFVADSATPPQSVPDVPQLWLRWEQDWVGMPKPGVTYSVRLQPLHAGTQLAGEEATGELIDQYGRRLSWRFDLPRITVLDPAAPPTPTTTPPATRPATPTATPTLTPNPTETATTRPLPLYLPRTLRLE